LTNSDKYPIVSKEYVIENIAGYQGDKALKKLTEVLMPDTSVLLEAGLSRIRHHLTAPGSSIGIIASATGDDNSKERHANLIRRTRELGYGPILASGRSKWGPEASIVVPNISKQHLQQLGNEFGQQAVIHAKGNNATMHYLKAAGDKTGSDEPIGQAHFNTPNALGVTVLKGLGFRPKDTRAATRSFTFKESECVLESLEIPPLGQLNPEWKPYI